MYARLPLFLLAAVLAPAQSFYPPTHWLIPQQSDQLTAPERNALLRVVCDGVEAPQRTRWTLASVRFGHFLTPASQDAFVTTDQCQASSANGTAGMLLTRSATGWKTVESEIVLETDHCRKMRFRNGRDLLVCETERGSRDGLEHSLYVAYAAKGSIAIAPLLTVIDTTGVCGVDGKLQKAVMQSLEFRDLNGDGLDDLSIEAVYGSHTLTETEAEQCRAAADAVADRQPGARLMQPRTVRRYRIDFLFDGTRFSVTPETKFALRHFQSAR